MNTDYLKKCAAKLLTEKQMSEAFLNNMFLALSGGLQDAYRMCAIMYFPMRRLEMWCS